MMSQLLQYNRIHRLMVLGIAGLLVFAAGCDSIFNSKDSGTTDEIFEQGRQDPKKAEDVVGYAALLPFWETFDHPTDVYVGFDELIYVTDAEGLHVLDQAGREFQTIEFNGAVEVVQDRLLNVYVSARLDTVVEAVDPDISWNLPAVFKLQNANGAGQLSYVDTLVHPFADASRSTTTAQRSRLEKDDPKSDENVEFTGLAVLSDNTLYVTRRGPVNPTNAIAAPDNIVLEFSQETENGVPTGKMRNIRQIRTLSPTTPSLISGIGMSSIATFIGPPQRESFTEERSFIITQADQSKTIPFRTLYVVAQQTPDGLIFSPNTSLLQQDTSKANGFLYEQFKFEEPSDVTFAADGSNYIFVVDKAQDKLYQFQSNGYEGVHPPPGSDAKKPIVVSFGGHGSGPKQFDEPSGVAYFDKVIYVADKNNNRIARYKLTTDFE